MIDMITKKIRLHILTPVNIGCDDVYEPTSFYIDKDKKKLISFDPQEFVKNLNEQDKRKLTQICLKGTIPSILELYHFINRLKPSGREVEVSTGLIKHYQQILALSIRDRNLNNKINQFTIYRTAYNPYNMMPIIPGSSLKGALRTAYISSTAKEQEIVNYWERHGLNPRNKGVLYNRIKKDSIAKKLEQDILKGTFSKDPFSLFKISDLTPVGDAATKILYAINRKKDGRNASGPYQILETLKEGTVFEGIVNLSVPVKGRGIRHTFTLEELLIKAHGYFARRLKEEIESVRNLDVIHKGGIRANSLFKERFKKDAFLIRIGRHSGAESVTIEGNRLILIKRGNKDKDYLDHATTLYLASEEPRPKNSNSLIPLGWVVVEVV